MNRPEIRQMIRRLMRRPGFTAAAVATLALGVGVTVAIFSVVYGVLVRPLPYAEADRLVGLWHDAPKLGFGTFNHSYGSYTHLRERAQTLEDAGLYDSQPYTVTGSGEPERLFGARVTASVMSTLGVAPTRGRAFGIDDEQPDGPNVVMLGHALWQRRFAGDEDVVGTVLQLDGEPWEVVGVMPEGFVFPHAGIDFWVPHPIEAEELAEVNFSFDVVARLADGATAEQARAELSALLHELPDAYPGAMSREMIVQSGMTASVHALRDDQVGSVRRPLWVLLAAVGFVLLIACANVANLLLVRAEGRHQELAVRAALGASRGRLARDLIAESLVLATLGGLLGVGLATIAVRAVHQLPPDFVPRLQAIRVDLPVLLFAGGVTALAGLLFGALPTLRLRAGVLGRGLAAAGRGGSVGRASRRVRNALVVAQVALALVLLFGSALMLRTFQALRGVDPGFDRTSVLTLRVSLHGERYETPEARARFWTRLVDEARALPGAAHAATVMNLPLTDGEANPGYVIEDFPPQPDDPPLVARQNFVTDGYFETLGIPILQGRSVERRDIDQRADSVVVSSAFARRIWGDENPVGKRLKRGLPTDQSAPWYEVVGVTGDVRDDSLTDEPTEVAYFPLLAQEGDDSGWTPRSMSVAVRSETRDPAALAPALRDLMRRLDPELPLIAVRTTAEIAQRAMARTTLTMFLLGLAALIALVLGSIGIYGVLAYSVAQRKREIGVRLALGAGPDRVRGMLVGQGLRLVALGIGIGLVGAVAAGRVLTALLYGVSAGDPLSLATVIATLVLVATAAAWLPARRAARIAPTEALRND